MLSSVSRCGRAIVGTGGCFRSLTPPNWLFTALTGLLERSGIEPQAIDDIISEHCYPTSEAPAIGRVAALDAGLPITVGASRSIAAADRDCRR